MNSSGDRRNRFVLLLLSVFALYAEGCDMESLRSAFPPEGYFDPIFSTQIEAGRVEYGGPITHEYSGKYSVSLAFEKQNPIGAGYDYIKLKLACSMESDSRIVEFECGQSLLEYWGKETSGISVATYEIPELVPVDRRVQFHLKFESADELEGMLDTQGQVSLFVEKWSDL